MHYLDSYPRTHVMAHPSAVAALFVFADWVAHLGRAAHVLGYQQLNPMKMDPIKNTRFQRRRREMGEKGS